MVKISQVFERSSERQDRVVQDLNQVIQFILILLFEQLKQVGDQLVMRKGHSLLPVHPHLGVINLIFHELCLSLFLIKVQGVLLFLGRNLLELSLAHLRLVLKAPLVHLTNYGLIGELVGKLLGVMLFEHVVHILVDLTLLSLDLLDLHLVDVEHLILIFLVDLVIRDHGNALDFVRHLRLDHELLLFLVLRDDCFSGFICQVICFAYRLDPVHPQAPVCVLAVDGQARIFEGASVGGV